MTPVIVSGLQHRRSGMLNAKITFPYFAYDILLKCLCIFLLQDACLLARGGGGGGGGGGVSYT